MNPENKKIERLKEYITRLNAKEDGRELYLEYKDEINAVEPQDAFRIFHGLLEEGMTAREILGFLDKIINVFHKSLAGHTWKRPENDNFLTDLELENQALKKKTDHIKTIVREPVSEMRREKLIPLIEELKEFYPHYTKKENILFPYMEKKMPRYEGLSIMWALHDEVKNQVEDALKKLRDPNCDDHEVNVAIAALFFGILGIVKKEEIILFPAACEVLSEQEWHQMHRQSYEYSFPFIEKKWDENTLEGNKELSLSAIDGKFKTETGELDFHQLKLLFDSLPVDMTFVDENNKVRFFTKPKDRIFPRSPAIIGRDVSKCHPPDSVHIVEEIVEAFRKGERDTAIFWIRIEERMILIQYFAMRTDDGEYKGVLEVSQDITEIRVLEGERRLLQWS
ncbi:MAG: DUF438 domain-containing protein [Bacillota bacterium]